MKTFNSLVYLILISLILTSCQQEKKINISLEKLDGSPKYSDAVLELEKTKLNEQSDDNEVEFSFSVKNYQLGAQTDSPNSKQLANSAKGQHIHFILNNEPYSAHYESDFIKKIPSGVNYLVAFLSRSYHESVKNNNSVVFHKLEVGDNPIDNIDLNMDSPVLIYSRPKGNYSKKDSDDLLLDFYLLNTSLSEDGNKVRVTVNGKEFIITEWMPHLIKGLPIGEVIIKLELLDNKGSMVPGAFNQVTRSVMFNE